MVEVEQCGFCRREVPADGPTCGPVDDQPCACCGLVIVATAPNTEPSISEEELEGE